jgi:hypothetical protein
MPAHRRKGAMVGLNFGDQRRGAHAYYLALAVVKTQTLLTVLIRQQRSIIAQGCGL